MKEKYEQMHIERQYECDGMANKKKFWIKKYKKKSTRSKRIQRLQHVNEGNGAFTRTGTKDARESTINYYKNTKFYD